MGTDIISSDCGCGVTSGQQIQALDAHCLKPPKTACRAGDCSPCYRFTNCEALIVYSIRNSPLRISKISHSDCSAIAPEASSSCEAILIRATLPHDLIQIVDIKWSG